MKAENLMSDKQPVLYELKDEIAWIRFNRPEARNAMNREVLERLAKILDEVRTDDAAKAVIVTGLGKDAFSAGADIRYLSQATPLEVRTFAQLAVSINHTIETMGKVVIAAINGVALGGGLELAESCALRLAVPQARLGHPEVQIGAIAGFGGTTRLPRLIGKGRAADLLLTGRLITSDEALQMGLVNRIVPPGDLLSEAELLARKILSQSPIAVNLTWNAIHRGLNLTLEESALLGADYFGLVATTNDFRIGTQSFLDKTRPSFTGS